ncbi:hypothetical protein CR513_40353, partial [Mucuna pruriens]
MALTNGRVRTRVQRRGASHPKAKKKRESYQVQLKCPKAEDGTIDSKSSRDELSSISNIDSSNEYSSNEGDLLMVKRLMSVQIGEDDDSQRKNIFHSCCHILGQLRSISIDGGSSVNFASSRLVEKLKLLTKAHPRPYKLQRLNSEGEIAVTKQVSLAFTLGKYEDEVL